MAETFKSVFRQRKVEKIYYISVHRYNYSRYDFAVCNDGENILSDDIIGTYDVEIPLLEPGDKFYLHDINETVIIKERVRSSNGDIIYYCVDKFIETENTKESFEKSQLQKEKFDELLEENKSLNQKITELKRKLFVHRNKYKYKHRWFNFKVEEDEDGNR